MMSAMKVGGIFHSFVATAPKHPLLLENIEQMKAYCRLGNRRHRTHLMGTGTLNHLNVI